MKESNIFPDLSENFPGCEIKWTTRTDVRDGVAKLKEQGFSVLQSVKPVGGHIPMIREKQKD